MDNLNGADLRWESLVIPYANLLVLLHFLNGILSIKGINQLTGYVPDELHVVRCVDFLHIPFQDYHSLQHDQGLIYNKQVKRSKIDLTQNQHLIFLQIIKLKVEANLLGFAAAAAAAAALNLFSALANSACSLSSS